MLKFMKIHKMYEISANNLREHSWNETNFLKTIKMFKFFSFLRKKIMIWFKFWSIFGKIMERNKVELKRYTLRLKNSLKFNEFIWNFGKKYRF